MSKIPCNECTDRQLGCHDECEKFKEFQAERIMISRKRRGYLSSRRWSDDGYNKFLSYVNKK